MKKVLVIGAGGSVGIGVIKYLLSEGKYEITALDLRNKNSQKRLKKYRRRINLIYADMNDSVLMDALVRDHDYIIHLAGIMPPIADIKKNISEAIDYRGTENIIKAMNMYNPDAYFIYASSILLINTFKKSKALFSLLLMILFAVCGVLCLYLTQNNIIITITFITLSYAIIILTKIKDSK